MGPGKSVLFGEGIDKLPVSFESGSSLNLFYYGSIFFRAILCFKEALKNAIGVFSVSLRSFSGGIYGFTGQVPRSYQNQNRLAYRRGRGRYGLYWGSGKIPGPVPGIPFGKVSPFP
jgi:hypothetical protein